MKARAEDYRVHPQITQMKDRIEKQLLSIIHLWNLRVNSFETQAPLRRQRRLVGTR